MSRALLSKYVSRDQQGGYLDNCPDKDSGTFVGGYTLLNLSHWSIISSKIYILFIETMAMRKLTIQI